MSCRTPGRRAGRPATVPQCSIRLAGISKVFYTEGNGNPRALRRPSRESAKASTSPLADRPGAARRRCSRSSACSIRRRRRHCPRCAASQWRALSAADRARVRNRQIGFIFQAFNLIGDLTVYENVELPLTYRGMRRPSARSGCTRRSSVWAWRTASSIIPRSSRAASSSASPSRGPWRGEPLILLADEPTGNLDSSNGEAVMGLLRELHEGGATICMVTHDPRFARHAKRAIHLFDGRVVEEEEGSRRAANAATLSESGFGIN